jgi:hypothetical protein
LTFKRLVTSIEIAFWDIGILLLSRSRLLQQLVRRGYHIFVSLRNGFEPAKLVVWAISGWALGFALGFIATSILH